MQTRRDQLQAYRFQNRRALAALVTGQPNVLEPPMRRLTVTTLSGIMIAVLIAVVFGILAIIRPSAGDSWKNPHAVIVDQDNNATYVYSQGTLHPVLNFTSAVLAVSGSSSVARITVSSSDIAGAKYGYEIGAADFPYSLPSAGSLVSFPMSTCSVLHAEAGSTTAAAARTTLYLGSDAGRAAVPSTQAVLVTTPAPGSHEWLLFGGQRLEVGSGPIATALGLGTSAPLVVGTPFLDSVPQGPRLAPPSIDGRNTLAAFAIGASHPRVGAVLKTSAGSFLVLRRHTVPLSALETDLYAGVQPIPATQAQVAPTELQGAALSTSENPLVDLSQLPPDAPDLDAAAATRGGLCAVFTKGAATPRFEIPSGPAASFAQDHEIESPASMLGLADRVDVPATKGLLATPANAPNTALIVSDQGVKYAFADSGLLSAFGYQASDAVRVPSQLLTMIPKGQEGLSRSAARQRVAP